MEDLLFKNLWVRALVPLILITAMNLIGAGIINELTVSGAVQWKCLIAKPLAYILLLMIGLLCAHQRYQAIHDKVFFKLLTPKQYDAVIRTEAVRHTTKKVAALVKKGNLQELEETTAAFRRMFGETKE